jgi:hypothetical protein
MTATRAPLKNSVDSDAQRSYLLAGSLFLLNNFCIFLSSLFLISSLSLFSLLSFSLLNSDSFCAGSWRNRGCSARRSGGHRGGAHQVPPTSKAVSSPHLNNGAVVASLGLVRRRRSAAAWRGQGSRRRATSTPTTTRMTMTTTTSGARRPQRRVAPTDSLLPHLGNHEDERDHHLHRIESAIATSSLHRIKSVVATSSLRRIKSAVAASSLR